MNAQRVCGCSTVFTVAFGSMLCLHPLFLAVAPGPTGDRKRLHILCLDCWVQQRPPFRRLVPKKQAFSGLVGRVPCFLSAVGLSSSVNAHHVLHGTTMRTPQGMCCSPVRSPGQGEKAVGGIVGVVRGRSSIHPFRSAFPFVNRSNSGIWSETHRRLTFALRSRSFSGGMLRRSQREPFRLRWPRRFYPRKRNRVLQEVMRVFSG